MRGFLICVQAFLVGIHPLGILIPHIDEDLQYCSRNAAIKTSKDHYRESNE